MSSDAGARRVETCGRQLDIVAPNATLMPTALDSFLLLVTGTDQAATREFCIARVRALRATFPRIYAHVLPNAASDNRVCKP